MLKLVVMFAALMTACSIFPNKKAAAQVRCQDQPQWTSQDAQGHDLGIYICFGPESRLLYQVRVLTPAHPTPSPISIETPKPAGRGRNAFGSVAPIDPNATLSKPHKKK